MSKPTIGDLICHMQSPCITIACGCEWCAQILAILRSVKEARECLLEYESQNASGERRCDGCEKGE